MYTFVLTPTEDSMTQSISPVIVKAHVTEHMNGLMKHCMTYNSCLRMQDTKSQGAPDMSKQCCEGCVAMVIISDSYLPQARVCMSVHAIYMLAYGED